MRYGGEGASIGTDKLDPPLILVESLIMHIKLIEILRVHDVHLVRVDPDNRPCAVSLLAISRASSSLTIIAVHVLDSPYHEARIHHIPEEFIPQGSRCELGTREVGKRAEVEPANHYDCGIQNPRSRRERTSLNASDHS